jgi:prevent-host-death family protein
MENNWSVKDAKAQFSEFLRQAKTKPQIITCHGKPKFEVRVITSKSSKMAKPRTLADWWLSAPTVPEFKLPPHKREKARKAF